MTRLVRAIPLLLCAVVLGACGGGGGPDLSLGVRRFALSLAFADADKAEPADPQQIVRLLPAPPGVDVRNLPPFPDVPTSLPPKCPAAPANAAVIDIAQVGISKPPAAGVYGRHNKGSITITTPIEIRLPFPIKTTWAIEDVREVPPPPVTEDPLAPAAAPSDQRGAPYTGEDEGKPMWEYRVRKTLTPEYSVVDTYRLTFRRVLLLQRETITPQGTAVFKPDPPITFFEHAQGESHTWASAGVDTATSEAMYIDAVVEKREAVDVCGTLHDAYRITMNEHIVNLTTGASSGTAEGEPNVYHLATQHGGLILREQLKYTQTVTNEDGVPGIVEWDYVSTQDSVQPEGSP